MRVTKYEFCWKVEPACKRQWQRGYSADGFDIEISGDCIFVRTDLAATAEDELKGRAENIAKNFVRAMAHKEKRWLVPEFAHIKRTVQTPERSDIGLRLEEQLPGMRDEVSWTKISYVKLHAVLIEHSQNLGLDELIRLSERARRSPSLQKMLDMQTAFYVDPEKKIAPLFDIVELIEAEYRGESGAAQALGISRKALEKVKRIANDPAIRTARHPGQAMGSLRDITSDELRHCIRTIEAIISEYATQIPV
jgi:hypothetical protein